MPAPFDPTNPNQLHPDRTALLVFDMLECYREKIVASNVIGTVQHLIAECRARQVPIFYAHANHRDDGADANRTLTDVTPEFEPWEGPQRFRHTHDRSSFGVLSELAPQPGDYDVPKHRWNAFFETHLRLSTTSRGIDTLLVVGGSTHVGVASTAFAARDMDYQVVIISDAVTGYEPQRSFFVEQVFPRMCRVRTARAALEMLDRTTTDS